MTYEEAKVKIKKLLMAEIDRLPSHYDSEINEVVYSDTAEVNELLELNKIVSEAFDALELQIPKKPINNIEQEWFECPTYRITYEGARATILLEYCGADSCGDCDNCVLGKAIEALEKQTHNCKDCTYADYMAETNRVYCLLHSCVMTLDNCCRDWSENDE